jgi:MFS family permease
LTSGYLLAGFRHIWRTQIVLAVMTLDMFGVLFGGATALMPIFAKDILNVGAWGFGLLRAAPSIGAVTMATIQAHRRPFERAGRTMLLAVAGFGAATIVFGLSRSFWLSLAMLFLLGICDNIRVVIRSTLIQPRTPDGVRGRVSAINGLFIVASNDLGAFESGLVAAWFTPTISVVSGGIGTAVVVAMTAWLWPQLRGQRRVEDPT